MWSIFRGPTASGCTTWSEVQSRDRSVEPRACARAPFSQVTWHALYHYQLFRNLLNKVALWRVCELLRADEIQPAVLVAPARQLIWYPCRALALLSFLISFIHPTSIICHDAILAVFRNKAFRVLTWKWKRSDALMQYYHYLVSMWINI